MAAPNQVKALMRCHADGDAARFYAMAMQVPAWSRHGNFVRDDKA